MGHKRMFSPDIVGSDSFIEMPVTAQCLYFHLGMRADDDGFVNPQITMRMVGANTDDLKILIAKRFLLQFQNGVVVVKHWRINNFIRKDRYRPTNYLDEKNQLRVKENQSYTLDEKQGLPIALVPWKSDAELRLTSGQPNVIPVVNAGKVRLGKVRLSKDSVERKIYGELENVQLTEDEHTKLCDKFGRSATNQLIEELSTYIPNAKTTYKNHYATLLNWARRKKIVEVTRLAPKVEEAPLTPEQMARNAELRSKITKMLKHEA
jgi:hypothetical protein